MTIALPAHAYMAKPIAEFFLSTASGWLILSCVRNTRTVLYVSSETLILLTITYLLRHPQILSFSAAFETNNQRGILSVLIFISWFVYEGQYRVPLSQVSPADASATLEENETQPITPIAEHDRQLAVVEEGTKFIRFNWSTFRPQLGGALAAAFFMGDNSPAERFDRWSHGKPNPPLKTTFLEMLLAIACMLEMNAVICQYIRTWFLQRYAHVLPRQPIELPSSTAEDAIEIQKRARTPIPVWIFMVLVQLSVVTVWPQLIYDVKNDRGDKGINIFQMITSSFTVLIFIAFVVVINFVPVGKVFRARNGQSNTMSTLRI